MGSMPFLSQTAYVSNIFSDYSPYQERIRFEMESIIFPGESLGCPTGFSMASSGSWCVDLNECLDSPCSHLCTNLVGAYSCSCPGGYAIAGDGHNCVDIDECTTEQYDCPVGLSCKNIPGGYKCGV